MKTYFDTGVLVKAYAVEPGTAEALVLIRQVKPPIPFTHLHGIEIRNALRLKCGRGGITESEMLAALRLLQDDIDAGRLERPPYELAELFLRAESLSSKHAVSTLARTLDILHVAAALEIGCKQFASFDNRQRSLASLEKLKTLPRED
ncbi:MAG TPA: type II toxin-antitoxin system VapC family toxin [Chthoniobacterales bacterium]|nr:type II toxin-antitoxin system VapC family toxin [Chthoniobacterales bacterium]